MESDNGSNGSHFSSKVNFLGSMVTCLMLPLEMLMSKLCMEGARFGPFDLDTGSHSASKLIFSLEHATMLPVSTSSYKNFSQELYGVHYQVSKQMNNRISSPSSSTLVQLLVSYATTKSSMQTA
jgi:hypothetical protein